MPVGIDAQGIAEVANTLANLGRDAVEPPVAIDHAAVEYRGGIHAARQGARAGREAGAPARQGDRRGLDPFRRHDAQGVEAGGRRLDAQQRDAALGTAHIAADRPARRSSGACWTWRRSRPCCNARCRRMTTTWGLGSLPRASRWPTDVASTSPFRAIAGLPRSWMSSVAGPQAHPGHPLPRDEQGRHRRRACGTTWLCGRIRRPDRAPEQRVLPHSEVIQQALGAEDYGGVPRDRAARADRKCADSPGLLDQRRRSDGRDLRRPDRGHQSRCIAAGPSPTG